MARLQTKPLSIVWGPPGLGKTGLALRVAQDLGRDDILFSSALDTPDAATFLRDLAQRLTKSTAEEALWSPRGGRDTDLLPVLLELAERAGATLLLDDLHALPDGLFERLILLVNRYAQKSRWAVLTRNRPSHQELADKTLRLDPLPLEDLVRLVQRCAPWRTAEEVERLARSALGSPYRARRLVLAESRAPGGSPLADLSLQAQRAALGLRMLGIAVPLPPDVERELDERGLLRFESSGVRLDDRLRALVDAEPLDVAEGRRAALDLLRNEETPKVWFETLRLAAASGDLAPIGDLLTRHRVALFTMGYAAPIFELLRSIETPALFSHLLACADWCSGGPSLAWAIARDPPQDPAERLVYLRLLTHGGALARALEGARDLVAHGPPELRAPASILLADFLRTAGDIEAAIELLEGLEVDNERDRIDRDLRRAMALAVAGQVHRSNALLDGLLRDIAELDNRQSRPLRVALAGALLAAARFRDLERLLGTTEPPADARGSELFAYLALSVERGRVALGRRLLERVRPHVEDSVILRFIHGYNEIRIRLAAGPLPGLEEVARTNALDGRALEYPELVVWARCARAQVDLVLSPPATLHELPAGMPGLPRAPRMLLAAWQSILAARRGVLEPPPRASELPVDVTLAVLRSEAETAILSDALAKAEETLTRAIELSRRHGLLLEEASLVALQADVRLLAAEGSRGGRALAELAARDLQTIASQLGSERFAAEARLSAHLASPERDAQALVELSQSAASPVARRRAAAILGLSATLDSLDRRIVETAAGRPRQEGPLILDVERKALCLPSRRVVDLSSAELHVRMLVVLARGRGQASKEELVIGAWEQVSYHPHRDDRRLHVAVHRLRQLLEQDPRNPQILLREGDGYRLGAPVTLGKVAM